MSNSELSDGQRPQASWMSLLEGIEDPRRSRRRLHELSDILVLTVLAVICGADGWVAVEQFGREKEAFLRQFLKLTHGIASHDTLGRVFARLRPDALRECFIQWTQALAQKHPGKMVAIDGKTLRRSFDRAANKAAIHMVSAWASDNHMVLGQLATDAKSNEITAIPKLLELLDLQGSIVTIDAMGCQTKIASQINEQGGDFVLSLKDNHPAVHRDVRQRFEWAERKSFEGPRFEHDTATSTDADHGRIEERKVTTLEAGPWFHERHPQWSMVKSVVCIESTRDLNDKVSIERHFLLSSLPKDDASLIATAKRAHWGIENGLHWTLDVAFREDDCRVRKDHAPENFAVIRHIALNLLKQEQSAKVGIKNKRLKAAWSDRYLLKILGF